MVLDNVFRKLAQRYPRLEYDLDIARLPDSPVEYLKKVAVSSLISGLIAFSILVSIEQFLRDGYLFSLGISVVFLIFISYYYLRLPQYNALKARWYIDKEIMSVIRFLLLELKSQRSLFDAMVNVEKNFPATGIYFEEVINEVKMGKTIEDSLEDAIDRCPSPHLRNLMWQLNNGLKTGSDITDSLENLLSDIEEEQTVKVEEYGKELNALSLFYMMIAIIIPTVGVTIVTAILTFVGIPIPFFALILVWFLLASIQYFFLKYAWKRRPKVEGY